MSWRPTNYAEAWNGLPEPQRLRQVSGGLVIAPCCGDAVLPIQVLDTRASAPGTPLDPHDWFCTSCITEMQNRGVLTRRQAAEALGAPAAHAAAIREVSPAPLPVAVATVTSFQWMRRFTLAERAAVFACGDADVRLVVGETLAAQVIELASAEVAAGVDLLVAKGLVAASRKAELLAIEDNEA